MVIDREYQRADALSIYLREMAETPLLTAKEEIDLAKRVKKGDAKARARMIKANLRLVVKIARDYEHFGLPLLDVINEGNLGLMKAVERFDPKKGAKLSTYASWWIKQSIRRALSNQSRTIRLPVHMADQVHKLKRVSFKLTETLGREPNDAELAEGLDISPAKAAQLRKLGVRPASLDAPIGDEADSRFSDIIEDESAATPFERLLTKSARQEIHQHVKHLDPREAEILVMRYGLDGQGTRTLEQVGKKFKVTRERIRQIQETALDKLRRRLESQEVGNS
ncbi:MAG TPA: sigma-70 family RNA polymerase sigma factor [Verrucomicrobiae bacterium]|nr:sigma-70 family RNA polymerase sigma factor [Verrucomicrobiae bacterium]